MVLAQQLFVSLPKKLSDIAEVDSRIHPRGDPTVALTIGARQKYFSNGVLF